jgi:hypothetical protein
MKKHSDTKHGALLKRYVEKVNICLRPSLEYESTIKCLHVNPTTIFGFFFFTNQFTKSNETQIVFLEDVINVVCDKRFFANENNCIHLVAPNGL